MLIDKRSITKNQNFSIVHNAYLMTDNDEKTQFHIKNKKIFDHCRTIFINKQSCFEFRNIKKMNNFMIQITNISLFQVDHDRLTFTIKLVELKI